MTKRKLNILNNMFSRNNIRHWINGKYDNIYISIVKKNILNPDNKINLELIQGIYSELRNNYRNEYYYKNTLLNKLLLGVHSINTTTALTEIPIAKSKADFILINGKAVVYEIKSDLDNFERLENQINDYYKAFNHVAVVTGNDNLSVLLKKINAIDKPIGIYILKNNGTLTPFRKPEPFNECLDMETIFKLLRKTEFEDVLKHKFGILPDVSQFKYYSCCKEMFFNIPLEEAYLSVLKQLKNRNKILKSEFDRIPYELKFLIYFMKLKDKEYNNLNVFLYRQYGGVQ